MAKDGPVGPICDLRELRRVFGRFATGITVVTAGREEPRGMTANSFTSVSLDPPMVLICVLRDAAMHETIQEHRAFAVSVLSDRQESVARYFADRDRPRGRAEFAAVDSVPAPRTGCRVLPEALAWFECSLAAVYGGGDHSIFLGEIVTFGHGSGEDALLFYGGAFRRLDAPADWRDHILL
ncbi:flavin reductase family protein [Microbispora sp. NBC_01189]|uniref:flavin reductase family protein n=1 Tax=unclassified Microbispora TaxID=2614687 RepID=UPI002E0D26FA|nr:flavin reductase family protein [Microbispora sp. NBC_01189]